MAVDFTKSSIIKSIQCGACTYWTKPLVEEEIKIMWQHVVRNGLTENKEHEIVGSLVVQENRKPGREDANTSKETRAKKVRLSWSPELHQRFLYAVNQLGLDSMILSKLLFFYYTLLHSSTTKLMCMFFSYFPGATPKKIQKIMDVPDITKQHVASHLQVHFCINFC